MSYTLYRAKRQKSKFHFDKCLTNWGGGAEERVFLRGLQIQNVVCVCVCDRIRSAHEIGFEIFEKSPRH